MIRHPSSRAGTGAADRATPLLRDRVGAVYRRLPAALAGDPDAVHDLRVATRRLRVALPVVAVNPERRRVTRILRVLRRLTRAAGASRDLDVALATLDAREGPRSAEAAVLRRRLREARGRSRRRMAEALLDLEIARLRRDLRVVLARRGEGLFVVLRRLHEARGVVGTEALAILDALGERYDPALLHRLRTRVRRLRYAAEIADVVRGGASGAAAAFKRLQDELGPVQDAHVLAEWLARQGRASAARGQAALATEARALAKHFQAESRARHREFLAGQPRETVREAAAALAGGEARRSTVGPGAPS